MRKKELFTTLLVLTMAMSIVGCGSKKKATDNEVTTVQTVSEETQSIASKELTKTGIVSFDYTDEEGNIYRLEGKAVASENGEAVIEVTDAEGNKAVFTGKATTKDGKLSVNDIAVKDAGTLVKPDGSKIEITTDATVADAGETDGESNSDIAVSEEIKKEVEAAKREETEIADARDEVKKVEETNAANNNGSNSNSDNVTSNETTKPTEAPTETPTEEKTEVPTQKPTEAATERPTETEAPTEAPTIAQPYFDKTMAMEAFELQNKKRVENGVAPLTWDDSLYDVCIIRAKEIPDDSENPHLRPDGTYVDSLDERVSGENIMEGCCTASEAIEDWYNSPSHQRNMINSYFNYGAIACYVDVNASCEYKWVALFRN